MAGNPFITAQLSFLNGDLKQWQDVNGALTNKLPDMVMLINFFQTWISQGYNSAVDSLPHGDSGNPGISEADIKAAAEKLFQKKWPQIADPNGDGTTTVQELRNDIAELMGKVRQIIANKSEVNSMIDDIKNQISYIQILQKQTL